MLTDVERLHICAETKFESYKMGPNIRKILLHTYYNRQYFLLAHSYSARLQLLDYSNVINLRISKRTTQCKFIYIRFNPKTAIINQSNIIEIGKLGSIED